jgi:hypothetical protein
VGSTGPHRLRLDVVPHELRVDTALAHAPGDQVRVLPAEVDDEDRTLLGSSLGKRDDLGLNAADSSATPS